MVPAKASHIPIISISRQLSSTSTWTGVPSRPVPSCPSAVPFHAVSFCIGSKGGCKHKSERTSDWSRRIGTRTLTRSHACMQCPARIAPHAVSPTHASTHVTVQLLGPLHRSDESRCAKAAHFLAAALDSGKAVFGASLAHDRDHIRCNGDVLLRKPLLFAAFEILQAGIGLLLARGAKECGRCGRACGTLLTRVDEHVPRAHAAHGRRLSPIPIIGPTHMLPQLICHHN